MSEYVYLVGTALNFSSISIIEIKSGKENIDKNFKTMYYYDSLV